MSGVSVINYLLSNHDGVKAIIADPDVSILSGDLGMNTPLPAISVDKVSGLRRNTVAMTEPKRLVTERVQVTVHANSYSTVAALIKLAPIACANRNGIVNGVDLDSILPDVEGPDLKDDASTRRTGSLDFIVKWRTA